MSDISHHSPHQTGDKAPASVRKTIPESAGEPASSGSLLERFLNSFFQEKNIRWLLLVGAAIIFGSSLMLVTRAWPHWSATLRAFTVLAYTVSLYAAGQLCRVRLQLNLTYKVLYGLTVLLIPISFLSLSWLSAGTAVQQGVLRSSLIAPFLVGTVFLWFASKAIFDHILRARQTTFWVCYCLLCMAGALPQMSSPITAFVFLVVAYGVMTAGVLKVNRHVFGLTMQSQEPRLFGFFPIALLGTLFMILVGAIAVPALPIHWMGFGCVLLAATVLLTAQSLMDVFRQSTGDFIRPFPWSISVPLLVGLCLTVVGVGLSFVGFSYVSASTFAVIPTALVAAGLMMRVGNQTKHSAFTWFALIFVTIAYQSCPVLFADIVQGLKDSAADAMRRERVPVSMYGLTYVPLLLGLAVALRHLKSKFVKHQIVPVQQFLIALNTVLLLLSFKDEVSAFFVAVANVILFACYGMILKERRFAYLSIFSGVVAVGFAIPALNDMQYLQISRQWIAPLLSVVAASLTVVGWPDRVLGPVSLFDRIWTSVVDAVWPAAESKPRDGELGTAAVPILQTLGSLMAIILASHWMVTAAVRFSEPLTTAALIQFGCLLATFAFYTLRNPHYFTGLCCHSLWVFVAVRWAMSEQFSMGVLLNSASLLSIGLCVGSALILKWVFGRHFLTALLAGKKEGDTAGEWIKKRTSLEQLESNRGWRSRVQAFVVPSFDLSFWAMWSLVAFVHIPAIILLNLAGIGIAVDLSLLVLWSTPLMLILVAAFAMRLGEQKLCTVTTICVPLLATAYLPVLGILLSFAETMLIWLLTVVATYCLAYAIYSRNPQVSVANLVRQNTLKLVAGLLVVSCFLMSAPVSVISLFVCGLLCFSERKQLSLKQQTLLVIVGNGHLFAAVVGLMGAEYFDSADGLLQSMVFAVCGISMLLFQIAGHRLHSTFSRAWLGVLLTIMVILFGVMCNSILVAFAVPFVFIGLLCVGIYEFREAIQKQDRFHIQVVWGVLFSAGFITWVQEFNLLSGIMIPYALLIFSGGLLLIERQLKTRSKANIFRKDLLLLAQVFPVVVSGAAVAGSMTGLAAVGHQCCLLMICTAIYGYLFYRQQCSRYAMIGIVLLNVSLGVLWKSLEWTSVEIYMVPAGFSVLMLSRVLRNDLPDAGRRGFQYVGAMMILLSPVLQVLDGSWQHMLLLLVLSVVIILAAIGLRVRSLVYCGSGFLVVDLLAMVVQSTNDSPTLLWAVGMVMGIGIMALAAYCERHREQLLSRLRMLSSELATWD
ncbi:MAG: hypothetical protein ABJZ55_08390 [Fuerstiella sp.]